MSSSYQLQYFIIACKYIHCSGCLQVNTFITIQLQFYTQQFSVLHPTATTVKSLTIVGFHLKVREPYCLQSVQKKIAFNKI